MKLVLLTLSVLLLASCKPDERDVWYWSGHATCWSAGVKTFDADIVRWTAGWGFANGDVSGHTIDLPKDCIYVWGAAEKRREVPK